MRLPRMVRVNQEFPSKGLPDVASAVEEALVAARLDTAVRKGQRIAITAGSRGIANIALIMRAIVDAVKAAGGEPLIVPAMGSHGGATAEGQRELVAGYGITEENMGAPILSSMDTVLLAQTDNGIPCYMDRCAAEADGVILCGRVKPHTDFKGPIESGLMKMLVIGLGKHAQAETIHSYGARGLREHMPRVARRLLATGKVLGGLAIVEDAYDQTAHVEWLGPSTMEQREQELLKMAAAEMARLPLDDIDLLIVDQMGKNISGTGMDTNVIGRLRIQGEADPERPEIRYILACSLTEASHGNALGIGLADLTTQRLVDRIDCRVMNENVVTTSFIARGAVPITLPNDRIAIETALRCLWGMRPEDARVVRIADTAHLAQIAVSEATMDSLPSRAKRVGMPEEFRFDGCGNLLPL